MGKLPPTVHTYLHTRCHGEPLLIDEWLKNLLETKLVSLLLLLMFLRITMCHDPCVRIPSSHLRVCYEPPFVVFVFPRADDH